MAFYDLSKTERVKLVEKITGQILGDLNQGTFGNILRHFSNDDTYIRKSGYLAFGKIYKSNENLQKVILKTLQDLADFKNERVRQTVVNAAGEIGMVDFEVVQGFFD